MAEDIRQMTDEECMGKINELYAQMVRNSAERIKAGEVDMEDEAFLLMSYMQDSKFRPSNVRGDVRREVWGTKF